MNNKELIYNDEIMIGSKDQIIEELQKELKRITGLDFEEVDMDELMNIVRLIETVRSKNEFDLVGIKLEVMDGSFEIMSEEELDVYIRKEVEKYE